MLNDDQLREILTLMRVIAIVGLSNDPDHDSYKVAQYLISRGFKIIPINPKYANLLGEVSYSDLITAQGELPENFKIDLVDIFRKPEFVMPHIEQALKIGAKVVWMQEGIEHLDGAKKAESAGLKAVMNKCIMHEHIRLFSQ